MKKKPIAVIAIGGNSLILDARHQKVEDQYEAICKTAIHIVDFIEAGYNVAITHGNGPQVGFILRRSELAEEVLKMHPVPLVSCDADTQGAIGYQIQQALHNELTKRGLVRNAVTVITQVEVDGKDKAFFDPNKPIGGFYSEEEMKILIAKHPEMQFMEDSKRGYRRVVPSPDPIHIIEIDAIRTLIEKDHIVISVGGGGIPILRKEDGSFEGVNAVIDKDFASALLAILLEADYFIITTGVDYVYTNFGTPEEEKIERMSILRAKELIAHRQFGVGSMLPKIQACIRFVEATGKEAVITSPGNLKEALEGKKGTILF
ncbi:MAG: carbamate kinase [Vallitaleaceae bacterium]|nr:carbamate kinase [Vallitaleaceae bacterium]